MTDSSRGRPPIPAQAAGRFVVTVAIVLAACSRLSTGAGSAPGADLDRSYPPDGGEAAAQIATAYGEQHPESFAGVFIDRQHAGRIVARFTEDLAEHQVALDALWGEPGMIVVVRATFTKALLDDIQQHLTDAFEQLRAQGIALMEIGSSEISNTVEVVAKSDDPRAEQIITAYGPPGAIQVELHPADKPWTNVARGPGWRLLGSFRAKLPYTVAAATNRVELDRQLQRYGIEGLNARFDPKKEIVAFFGFAVGSSCPEVRIDGVTIDVGRGLVYGNFSDPLSPRAGTADLVGSVTFVVALERVSLPASPFKLRLERDVLPCSPDCPRGDDEIVVDLR